jgi:hypothetical protein
MDKKKKKKKKKREAASREELRKHMKYFFAGEILG